MPTNINDATYFELRLVEVLCQARGIEFSYKSDLERYKKLVFKSHGELGQNKIEVQEKRLTKGLRAFLEKTAEIEISSGQTLTDIDWVGRNHIGSRVADVDLFFGRNHVVPVSVKSGGPGTDRNLAGRSLKDLLNYDSQLTMREMMNETLDVLRNAVPDIKLQPAWKPMRESVD